MTIRFENITPDNWRIFNALKVKDEQKEFVASNVMILARAFVFRDNDSRVYAVYNDNTPIGLVMQRDYVEDSILFCVLDQFMIDAKYQGQGYGKIVMQLWLNKVKNEDKHNSIILCYKNGDEPAMNLYLKMGFYHTGDIDEDEIVLQYNLK